MNFQTFESMLEYLAAVFLSITSYWICSRARQQHAKIGHQHSIDYVLKSMMVM